MAFLPLFSACALSWIRRFFDAWKERGSIAWQEKTTSGTLSAGQAVGAALAATVGTGNIVGTAQAIAMGGPGAVFWMWAAALLGMPVKAAEIMIGQRMGGAMAYIRRALGLIPAWIYGLLALGNVLILGNMAQVNAAASLFRNPFEKGGILPGFLVSLMLTTLIMLSLRKGISGVSTFCVRIVFAMAGLYMATCTFALTLHARQILPAFRLILRCALQPKAIGGAAAGLFARNACIWGLKRGAFSNESGLGTAANIHAYTAEADPTRNALFGVMEVFVDTILLCTLSAIVILSAGISIPYGSLPGSELMLQALAASFGDGTARWLLGLCLGSFALSTILGSYIVGHRCAASLGIEEAFYRSVFMICTALGPILPLRLIWKSADLVNVLMALPNMLALLLLARDGCRGETRISRKLKNPLLPRG